MGRARSPVPHVDRALAKALQYSGSALTGAVAKSLQAQRHAQGQQLTSRSGHGFLPQLCVDMAQDNVLAKRNEHGRALAFLLPDGDPTANIDLLGHYLMKLGMRPARPTPGLAQAVRACADLAACYLTHTSWFEDAPVSHYAHLANKLSKYPSGACSTALAWIAGEVLRAPSLLGLKDKEVCLLAGAFAKNPQSGRCRDAVLRMEGCLGHHGAAPRQKIFSISVLLNALSKWADEPEARDAALRLADDIVADGRLRHAMDEHALTNVLNALSKWADQDRARMAALLLADRIEADDALVRSMKAQGVANAVGALSKWPDESRAREGAVRLADRISADARLRYSMNALEIGSTLNGLSKWPACAWATKAASRMSESIVADERLRNSMNALQVANGLNALAKWHESDWAREAALRLAECIVAKELLGRSMEAQEISNALQALSKWPDEPLAREGAMWLAQCVAANARLRQSMNALEVANALNALAKWPAHAWAEEAALLLAGLIEANAPLRESMGAVQVANALNALGKWSEGGAAEKAAQRLAERIDLDDRLRKSLSAQHVANALNAVGKWPLKTWARTAALRLARRIEVDAPLRQSMNAQAVANALGALGKWFEDPGARSAALHLAKRIETDVTLRQSMDAQEISNAIGALSKWPDEGWCKGTAMLLAERIAADDRLLQSVSAQGLGDVLNALGKWPEIGRAREIALLLADRIALDEPLVHSMDATTIASVLNGLGHWPDEPRTGESALPLAERIVAEEELVRTIDAQGLANALNALSKWSRVPEAQQAAWQLATNLGSASHPWRNFNMLSMAQIGNAMARQTFSAPQDPDIEQRVQATLHGLASHLELHPRKFEVAGASHIGVLFKAFASARMPRAMRPLAEPALARIQNLCRETQLRGEALETIGNLCVGLLPFVRSPELTRHRGRGLLAFNALQPILERKIRSYLHHQQQLPSTRSSAQGNALRLNDGTEAFGTRCPALTFYQVLKAYSLVSGQWQRKPGHVDGDRQTVEARQAELRAWVEHTLQRTRQTIEADLQEMSWNVIAQIEAGDDVLDALDLRIRKEFDAITQRHRPSRFDLGGAHAGMRTGPGAPRPVPRGIGETTHLMVDLQGRQLERDDDGDEEKPYSLYARLTGLPLVEVRLPGAISGFMLARTFHFQGEPWRFDLFGGSRLQRGRSNRVQTILSGAARAVSTLPAIRYADTAPGSDLMALTAKLAPQREDWSRMQRALLEMVPRDHVVEGTLRMGWFDDVEGMAHPFKLSGPGGQRIAVCPNDGCGFLKWDVAMQIPAVRRHIEAWDAVQQGRANEAQRKIVAAQESGFNGLAPQALQHFPRDEAALAEASDAMNRKLGALLERVRGRQGNSSAASAGETALSPEDVDRLTLYQLTVSGGYEGRRIRAVPSADDKVHLPPAASVEFDRLGGDLLVGKAPYDKENLLPVAEDRVGTAARGDATARFLSECFAIQYSYTGFDDDSGPAGDMLHSKGMLIIPRPGYWSPAHADIDLACSKEDMKTLSRWVRDRDRVGVAPRMTTTGSLRVKDVLLPGRLGALPIAELRKRTMDTDGDDAFVYAGYPRLAEMITRVMEERGERRRGAARSFKPPKTANPAFDEDGDYQPGRAREILAEQRGGRLVGSSSNAFVRFLSQPDELRHDMARHMMFGVYDGVERSLRNGLRQWLDGSTGAPSLPVLQERAWRAIERAHLPEAREAAVLLHALTLQLQEGTSPVPPGVPPALAQRFESLDRAYGQAGDTASRLHAVLDHYPVCRLSHEQFPEGQPGWVEGQPELTMRNLFTIAVKVGTDALKSDTGTEFFSRLVERCEAAERSYPERVRSVPHTKQTARLMRDGRFDPEQAKSVLKDIPTMAAGVMQVAVASLQQAGLLVEPPAPIERLRTISPQDIAQAAEALKQRAAGAEPGITHLLRTGLNRWLGDLADGGQVRLDGLKNAVESSDSLKGKLQHIVSQKQVPLQEAAALVDGALRYSVVLPPDAFTDGLRCILAELDGRGHAMTRRANHFTKLREAFGAVSAALRAPDGMPWEIQFHTPETFALKVRFHDLYKDAQTMRHRGAKPPQLREFLRPAWLAFRAVALPAGCEDIEDWDAEPLPRRLLPATQQSAAQASRGVAAHLVPLARRIGAEAQALAGKVTPLLWPILQTCDGARLQGGEQQWQRHAFKNERSIARKIALLQRLHQLAPHEAAARVRDALRYVIVLPPGAFGDAARGILGQFERRGVSVMRINNAFSAEATTYAGLNVKLHLDGEGGGNFEIQFHTVSSLRTKNRAHKLYEKLRELPAPPSRTEHDEAGDEFRAERERLLQALREMAAQVERPEGIAAISSFSRYPGST